MEANVYANKIIYLVQEFVGLVLMEFKQMQKELIAFVKKIGNFLSLINLIALIFLVIVL
jgi:hypothetical protein